MCYLTLHYMKCQHGKELLWHQWTNARWKRWTDWTGKDEKQEFVFDTIVFYEGEDFYAVFSGGESCCIIEIVQTKAVLVVALFAPQPLTYDERGGLVDFKIQLGDSDWSTASITC